MRRQPLLLFDVKQERERWLCAVALRRKRQPCMIARILGAWAVSSSLLRPGGRFVLADVVVPEYPEDAITPLSPDYDDPSALPEQLDWLQTAGLSPSVSWKRRDLAVIAADRRT